MCNALSYFSPELSAVPSLWQHQTGLINAALWVPDMGWGRSPQAAQPSPAGTAAHHGPAALAQQHLLILGQVRGLWVLPSESELCPQLTLACTVSVFFTSFFFFFPFLFFLPSAISLFNPPNTPLSCAVSCIAAELHGKVSDLCFLNKRGRDITFIGSNHKRKWICLKKNPMQFPCKYEICSIAMGTKPSHRAF